MGIMEYRAKVKHDNQIRDAVARAVAPGLLDLIESGQRLTTLEGVRRRSMNDRTTFELIAIIADYRSLMGNEGNTTEAARAEAALACGHGYTLMDSCPGCDNYEDPTPRALPLIALVRVPEGEDD